MSDSAGTLALVKLPSPNENSGPLAGHVRKGRVYRSPLAASGVLFAADWVRDDLPDLLWPVLALSELGTAGRRRFVRWQKAVQDDLTGMAEADFIAECLDGRLTSLDRLAARFPEARSAVKVRAEEHGLLPGPVVNALASYPHRPAEWLISREVTPPGQGEIDVLAQAVLGVLTDSHREAVIKCLRIWSAVQAGTFSCDAATIDLLKQYPADPGTRAKAGSVIRATWGAHKAALKLRTRVRTASPTPSGGPRCSGARTRCSRSACGVAKQGQAKATMGRASRWNQVREHQMARQHPLVS
jgi:hypothetical protein